MGEDSVAYLADTYTDRAEAESAYHVKIASAVMSSVPVHSVSFLNNEGVLMESKCYSHQTE